MASAMKICLMLMLVTLLLGPHTTSGRSYGRETCFGGPYNSCDEASYNHFKRCCPGPPVCVKWGWQKC